MVCLGEAMKEKDITISHVYASASLRCVETASSILQGKVPYHIILLKWSAVYYKVCGPYRIIVLKWVAVYYKVSGPYHIIVLKWPAVYYKVNSPYRMIAFKRLAVD